MLMLFCYTKAMGVTHKGVLYSCASQNSAEELISRAFVVVKNIVPRTKPGGDFKA